MKWKIKALAFTQTRRNPNGFDTRGTVSETLWRLTAGTLATVAVLLALSFSSVSAWAQVSPGDILIADPNAINGNGAVIKVDPVTGAQTVLSQGQLFQEPVGIVVSPTDGFIYVTDRIVGVIRVDPATGTQTLVASGFIDAFGITVGATGILYITDTGCPTHASPPCLSGSSSAAVYAVDPSTNSVTLISSGGFLSNPFGIEIEETNLTLVVSDASSSVFPYTGAGGIIRITIATGTQTPVTVGTAGVDGCPFGITVDDVGRILTSVFDPGAFPPYGCSPGAIWRTATAAGPNSPFSPHTLVNWQGPFGLYFNTPDQTVLVVDEFYKAVYRVNAAGLPTLISQLGFFVNPTDVTVYRPATTPPLTGADLSVTKTDNVSVVTAGESTVFTYEIVVTNNGPLAATDVILQDTWPEGFDRGATTTTQGTCTQGDGNFSCALGTIAAGGSVTVRVDYMVPATTPGGTQTNTVTVSSSTPDPNTGNNTASDTNTVSPYIDPADLSLSMTDSADPAVINKSFSYILSVKNSGPDPATSLVLTNTLPAGVTFLGASGGGWTCSLSGRVVTCTRANMSNGATSTITINVRPTVSGPLVNSASVRSSIPDPNLTNNSDTETTTVQLW